MKNREHWVGVIGTGEMSKSRKKKNSTLGKRHKSVFFWQRVEEAWAITTGIEKSF